ncbi:Nuclear pore complex protein Nup214 [Amphibalanus amphitrite]|uniref:Nuclear pore complex protein Nup214 n=1 Tax=Amphibalanus amphitrite TaxID=1232801 RepID=A0A6A4W067_AMPAM|nr:Nuclear pore complex protein Nup214 [Amphibalanus amphitrite]KAF0300606.1 Nuclear pore complex protein Nup214 [Amphibalanus amphitrite]
MSLVDASCPVEVQDFRFLQLKPASFEEKPAFAAKHSSCLAACNKYGLLFVALGKTVKAVRLSDLTAPERDPSAPPPVAGRATLAADVTHVALSGDQLTLLVATTRQNCAHGYLYDVRAFAADQDVRPFAELRLSAEPADPPLELLWNPVQADLVAVVFQSGSLALFQVAADTGAVTVHRLPAAIGVRCGCWSRKGKQLVVGRRDGRLTQLRPDLSEARSIAAPPLADQPAPPEAVSVSWLNTYEFMAGYLAAGDSQPQLVHVSAPKQGAATYSAFQDVCFGSGEERRPLYYLHYVAEWSVVLAASSCSLEVAVLGAAAAGTDAGWLPWLLEGDARAELPLADGRELFPTGLAVSSCSQRPVPWGESSQLPPAPTLHLLTDTGLLCSYHLINLKDGAPAVTEPPQDAIASEARVARQPIVMETPAAAVPAAAAAAVSSAPASGGLPTFGAAPASSAGGAAPAAERKPVLPTTPAAPADAKPAAAASRKNLAQQFSQLPQEKPQTAAVAATPSTPGAESTPGETQQALDRALDAELDALRKELAAARQQADSFSVDLGDPAELSSLRQRCAELGQLCSELRRLTGEVTGGAEQLTTATLELATTVEEARALQQRSRDPRLASLLRMRPLEPGVARQMAAIRASWQYIDSQLTAAGLVLDQRWAEYQQSRKHSRPGWRSLRMDSCAIHRLLVNNRQTILRLQNSVSRLASALEGLRLPCVPAPGHAEWSADVSRLGDQLAAAELTVAGPAPRRAPLTPARRDRLRAALGERRQTPVRRSSPGPARSRLLATPLLSAPPAAGRRTQPQYEDISPVGTPPGSPPPSASGVRDKAPASAPVQPRSAAAPEEPRDVSASAAGLSFSVPTGGGLTSTPLKPAGAAGAAQKSAAAVAGAPTSGAASSASGGSLLSKLISAPVSGGFTGSGGGFSFGLSSGSSPFATAAAAATKPVFGGGAASSSFGGGGTSVFGSTAPAASTGSVFGGAAGGSGGGGGFGGFGLGGKPSPENANRNVFGGGTTFGQGGGASSLFGGGGVSSPVSSAAASPGLGSPSRAGAGAFGAAPTFGSSPGLGGASAFGAAPTFGAAGGFGAAAAAAAMPTFGQAAAAAPATGGFASFAAADAPSFGAVANQGSPAFGAGTPQAATPAFGSGGANFGSWRS